jgi:hypothetical protein
VDLAADPDEGRFQVLTPGGEPLTAGPASLLLHRHNDQLWDLRNCVVTGELSQQPTGWVFSPTRFIPGSDGLSPLSMLRALRHMRRTADNYLATRQLPRPEIAWGAFKELG